MIRVRHRLSWSIVRIDKPLLAGRKSRLVYGGRRGQSEPIFQRRHGRYRQPIHRFRFDPRHDRFPLKLTNLLPEVPVRPLRVLVRFERDVPRTVVSELARYEPRAVLSGEQILKTSSSSSFILTIPRRHG